MNSSRKSVGHLGQGFKVAKFQGFGCSGEGRNYPTSVQQRDGTWGTRLEWGTRLLLFLLVASMLYAQQGAPTGQTAPPRKEGAPRWTRYCLEAGGFCLEHPAGWRDLGAAYGGAGVVFAEPNRQRAQTEWNNITAAALDLPESSPQQAKREPNEPATGGKRPSLNELINQAMTAPEGATIHTLERMETIVGGYPAQVVTAEVLEQAKAIAIEQVAFIDADDVLYSVALRCAPADYRRLKPVFFEVLKSWSENA